MNAPAPAPPVRLDVAGGVATVTIDRPTVRNALNSDVLAALDATLTQVFADEDAHLLVFTGAGDKAFVAGADIGELVSRTPLDGLRSTMQRLYQRIADAQIPTIAAVNGYAFGGGCELALACDIRIASARAVFCLPETGLGILPGAGGTQRLARLVGRGRAIEMILTGRRVDAQEALGMGLVTQVVPGPELTAAVRATADLILAKGPTAVRLVKTAMRYGLDADEPTGLAVERLAQAVLYSLPEKAEGTAAFLEKRQPNFRGEQP